MKKLKFVKKSAITFIIGQMLSVGVMSNDMVPGPTRIGVDAFDIYSQLKESGEVLKGGVAQPVEGEPGVTYGAEKEGSSYLVTRIAGPSGMSFLLWIQAQPRKFREEFLRRFVSGESRNEVVKAKNGRDISFNEELLAEFDKDYSKMTPREFKQLMETWVFLTKGRPFSYLNNKERKNLYKGTAPHQVGRIGNDFKPRSIPFAHWVAHHGEAQKYVMGLTPTDAGWWEVNFLPQAGFGDFKKMIQWFKTSLENAGKLFHSPGHQRVVFPSPETLGYTGPQMAEWQSKMGEVFRMIQAYIVIRGIYKNTKIEKSRYKDILRDSQFDLTRYYNDESKRGVVRIDQHGRFVKGTYSIELRAGTKDAPVADFIETVIASRVHTGDLADLTGYADYELYEGKKQTAKKLMQRFGVSKAVADAFIKKTGTTWKPQYLIPIWHWENAPFLEAKRDILLWETRRFIENVAASTKRKAIKWGIKSWLRSTDLERSVYEYLRPKKVLAGRPVPHHFASTGRINVNEIDLGIEYSARFGNRYSPSMSSEIAEDGNKIWLETVTGMTPYERKEKIKSMAAALGKEITGKAVTLIDASTEGAHGHGISIAYEFRDNEGRKWRAEWDGVGRTYDSNGEIIGSSLRGGHIEIVTPKFQPTFQEMSAVYRAMHSVGVLPGVMGGGHINVDLAPFMNNPKALARFLTIFHQHRGIIAYMFQNMTRLFAAEPAEVSRRLANALKNFNGTELELKQLLYNEQYFNRRLGRKTRNVHIDMSAYFQDVIPEHHLHEDFDMKNPRDPWRPQFRVNPKIRKMEFRLFDAPIDVYESSLQIKLVRAMLNLALNETTPLEGKVQRVDHEGFAENYDRANRALKEMCETLGLSEAEYKAYLLRAVESAHATMARSSYVTFAEKAKMRGWKLIQGVWGKALETPRTAENQMGSEGRHWSGTALPEAEVLREARVNAAKTGSRKRGNRVNSPQTRRALKISVNCREVFNF